MILYVDVYSAAVHNSVQTIINITIFFMELNVIL